MELFKNESSNPKYNTQRNLCGRTHYVDNDTLRFHKSRILSAHVADHGLLFAIVTIDALDMRNTKRGYRYVIFDIFGTVLSRTGLENAFARRAAADKAMWAALNAINAKAHTLAAIEKQKEAYAKEMERLAGTVEALQTARGL